MEMNKEQIRAIIKQTAYNLLGLGAPVERDDQGFNKPDYSKMVHLLPAISAADAEIDDRVYAFIANVLVKYVRQINEVLYAQIKEYAKENPTVDSYYGLKSRVQYVTLAEELRKGSVNATLVDGRVVELSFNYDKTVLAAVKSIPTVKARTDWSNGKQNWFWQFDLRFVPVAIETIEKVAPCPDLHEIAEEMQDEIKLLNESGEKVVILQPKKLYVEEIDNNSVALKFAKDFVAIDAVRSVHGRKWNKEQLYWSIPKSSVASAYETFKAIDFDVTELAGFLPETFDDVAEEIEQEIIEEISRFKGLYEHQKKGIAFLMKDFTAETVGLKGKILADDMGLGKTRQSIIGAYEMLRKSEVSDKVLIVCPASLRINWDREIKAVFPMAETFIVNGKGWVDDLVEEANWIIINYDLLKKFENKVVSREWAVVIADEAHYLKNIKAQRSKIFFGHKSRSKTEGKDHPGIINHCEKAIYLTGTPITSHPADLFNLLRGCNHPLGKNWMYFVRRYCNAQQTRFGLDISGSSNLPELHRLIKTCLLRRTKEECLDMPEKTRRILSVPIDMTAYNNYWLEYLRKMEEQGKMLESEHLAMMIKLRVASAAEKVYATIEEAENVIEAGEKVIIFTNFTNVVDRIMSHFGDKAVKVVGGMSDKAKQESVDQFQNNPDIKVFVGNLKAAGVGLTLTAATQVIMNDFDWVPSNHLQAEDRAYRIGQKNNVTITYMSAVGTIDEQVTELLARKLEVISNVIEGKTVENNNIFGDLVFMLWGVRAA